MRHYAAEFWAYYGVNPIDVWVLEADDFFGKVYEIECRRREAERKK